MTLIKKFITLSILIIFTSTLVGCATTYHRGDGVIIAEKRIKDKDYKPHRVTETGALIGGSVGGAGGAITGGSIGFLVGLFSNSIPIAVLSALSGGVAGALVVGAAGSVIGGGLGYAVDATTPGAGVYEFTVKSGNERKLLTITQYTTPIPLNTPVHILEKNNLIFIKKK